MEVDLQRAIARQRAARARQAQTDNMGLPQASQGFTSNTEAVNDLQAFGRGAAQGAMLGGRDEAAGLDAGVFGITRNPDGSRNWFDYSGSFGDRFRGATEAQRAADDAARQHNNTAFQTGQVAGTLAPAAAAAPLATGAGLGQTMLRGAGLGGVEGAVAGAGNADGGNLPTAIAEGAGIGATVGGLAPAAIGAGASAAQSVGNLISGVAGIGNRGKANRSVAQLVKKSGQTPEELTGTVRQAVADGQPEFRLMDALGNAGRRRVSGIVRRGDDGAEELRQFLDQRQADAKDRVQGFTDEAFGLNGQTRQQAEDGVRANRKAVADAIFTRAAEDAQPVDVRGVVSQLDETISQMSNSGIEPPAVVKEFQSLRKRLAGQTPEGDPTTLSDYESVRAIYQEVRDKVDDYYTPGSRKTGVAEALKPIRDSLNSALEQSSDLYSTANQLYRVGSGVVDAFQRGADAAKRGRAADNIEMFGNLTEQEQRAARIGFGDEVQGALERNKATNPNPAREFGSTKRQQEAGAIALDPDLFARRINRENEMFATRNRATGGSLTADNQQDIAATGMMADIARSAQAASSANFGQALTNAARALSPYVTGETQATRELIARALMSSDPESVLAPAVSGQRNREAVRRILEGLTRGGFRQE